MSNMQIDSVLAQIRSLSSQAGAPTARRPDGLTQLLGPATGTAATGQVQGGPSAFASLLRSGLDQVNQAEQRATSLANRFERGEQGVDLAQVMLETNKANLSFRAATEVRNRLVSAYQDIMNMQL